MIVFLITPYFFIRTFSGLGVAIRNENSEITKWFGTWTDINMQKSFSGELTKQMETKQKITNM